MEIIKRRWVKLSDQDPDQPELLSELLLNGALIQNASGCVVFSSRHTRHIRLAINKTFPRFSWLRAAKYAIIF